MPAEAPDLYFLLVSKAKREKFILLLITQSKSGTSPLWV